MLHGGNTREGCRLTCILLLLAIPCTELLGQSGSDASAVPLASQSINAITGGQSIQDVTLTGTVSTADDEDQPGNATLLALGSGESRMDLAFPNGIHSEIRDAQSGIASGKWVNTDGSSGEFANHNCWTDAAWFFPALGSLGGSPNVVLLYIGLEQRNGVTVHHVRSYVNQQSVAVSPNAQELSVMDFYLDAASLLPTAVTYQIHPDDNADVSLPIEVDFSNYQTISGVAVPTHIERYLQGHIQFDITVTGASFNSGLSMSTFAVN
jgi:hypothetical protein